MDPKQARAVAEELRLSVGTNSEHQFQIFAAIVSVEWLDDDGVWIAEDDPIAAHWIVGDGLVSVIPGQDSPQIEYRPIVAPASWGITTTFQKTRSGDPLDKRLWMISNWSFRLADGHRLDVQGEIATSKDGSEARGGEKFARRMAEAMLGLEDA